MIPSGKLIALIIFSLCLVAGAFYYAEHKNSTASIYKSESQSLVKNTIDTNKDTDGDGILDWEETLWGTDPNIKDADKLQKTPQSKSQKKEEHLTATDTLARSFFSQYMNLKQVGLQNDKQSQESAAVIALQNSASSFSIRKYELTDIKISNNIILRDYINSLGTIFKKRKPMVRSEIDILREAITTNNKTVLKELDPALDNYKMFVREIKSLPVPEKLSNTHLHLLNSINKLGFVVELFSKSFVDPVAGVQGLSMFQEAFSDTVDSFRDVVNVVTENKILYSTSDPGSFFSKKTQ